MARAILKYWPALAFVVGTLLAISVLPGTYVDPKFPVLTYRVSFWVAISICAVLIICLIWNLINNYIERDVVERFHPASRDEIQDVLPFYDRIIGGAGTQRPSINALKAMFNANRNIFRIYKREAKRGEKRTVEVKGFCTVIPVNQIGADLLASGNLNGLKMDATHICSERGRCAAIYIGSIGAEGSRAKGDVLSYVLGVIDEYKNKGISRAYTRPVTQDGLRVAKRYGFKPLASIGKENELGEIYYLDLCEIKASKKATIKR